MMWRKELFASNKFLLVVESSDKYFDKKQMVGVRGIFKFV